MSDSVRPHRRQPTRLPRPWDSPGKNSGVGCHFLLQCMKVKSEGEVARSCPTLSDPMDCSPPGSSIHGFSRQEHWSGAPLRSPAEKRVPSKRMNLLQNYYLKDLRLKAHHRVYVPSLLWQRWSEIISGKEPCVRPVRPGPRSPHHPPGGRTGATLSWGSGSFNLSR